MIFLDGAVDNGEDRELSVDDRANLDRLKSRKHRYTVWAENNGQNKIGTRYSFGNGNESKNIGLSFERDAWITTASYTSVNSGNSATGSGVLEILLIDDEGMERVVGTIARGDGRRRGSTVWAPAIKIPAGSQLAIVSATNNTSAAASIVCITVEENE